MLKKDEVKKPTRILYWISLAVHVAGVLLFVLCVVFQKKISGFFGNGVLPFAVPWMDLLSIITALLLHGILTMFVKRQLEKEYGGTLPELLGILWTPVSELMALFGNWLYMIWITRSVDIGTLASLGAMNFPYAICKIIIRISFAILFAASIFSLLCKRMYSVKMQSED